jgi:hypothetical protein
MSKRLHDHSLDSEGEFGDASSTAPTRKSVGKRENSNSPRSTRDKNTIARRKENAKGGIHQRANKRTNW